MLTTTKILFFLTLSVWGHITFSLFATPNAYATDQTISAEANQSIAVNHQPSCANSQVITMGYKYGEGANPFALIGKCIKLKNVTPIQYINAKKALVTWHHRGEKGTFFVEDKSDTGLSINNAKILLGRSVGTYKYTTVLGSTAIVPHLIIE